jgi:hypothetical protein
VVWDIVWGKDKFVATGYSKIYNDPPDVNIVAYSSDGTNWNAVTLANNFMIAGIAWGGGKFVAVGIQGQNSKIAYSTNGIDWTIKADSGPFDGISIYDIAWGGPAGKEKFVAVGDEGMMAYSSDGIDWTAVSNDPADTDNILGIAWGGDRFVAWNDEDNIAYSLNGINWTPISPSPFDEYIMIIDIAWGNGKFVATGYSINYDYLPDDNRMAYSSDGITWISMSPLDKDYIIMDIAWGGDKFVSVGANGRMAYCTRK